MRFSSVQRWGAMALFAGGVAAGGLWWASRPVTAYEHVVVMQSDVESTVTAIGTLQPRRYVDVGAQVSGQITRLLVVWLRVAYGGQAGLSLRMSMSWSRKAMWNPR